MNYGTLRKAVWGIFVIIIVIIVLYNIFPIIRDIGKSDLEEWVKDSFQETMLKDDTNGEIWREYGGKVESVTLIRKSWSEYNGIVRVSIESKNYDISISVTNDRRNAMWKTTELFPFAFLSEIHLRKWQEENEYDTWNTWW